MDSTGQGAARPAEEGDTVESDWRDLYTGAKQVGLRDDGMADPFLVDDHALPFTKWLMRKTKLRHPYLVLWPPFGLIWAVFLRDLVT